MILTVEPTGYVDATEAFRQGNRAAADEHLTLLLGLRASAGMAGSDAVAADFAAAYDGAARDALAGLGDLAGAFATLGRLTEESLANHADAEARSIIPGAVVAPGGLAVPAASYVGVLPATPPASLGADPPTLSPQEAWILDQVAGFVWPDGDVDRLRQTAACWRRTADRVDSLAGTCRIAAAALGTQRSPEIPLAVAAADDLGLTTRDLAAACAALGEHCLAHADAIEDTHARTRALLAEILRFVIEGMLISAVLGALTAGSATAVGAAAVAARVATYSPRFAALLATFRSLTAATTAAVRLTHDALRAQRLRLARFLRTPARGERGALRLGGSARWPRGWLARHERSGHTIAKHVGKTEEELRDRIVAEGRAEASSFPSKAQAERVLESVLRTRSESIERWLASGRDRLRVDELMSGPTGVTVRAGESAREVSGVRVILERDASMPAGYRIVTAFPQP